MAGNLMPPVLMRFVADIKDFEAKVGRIRGTLTELSVQFDEAAQSQIAAVSRSVEAVKAAEKDLVAAQAESQRVRLIAQREAQKEALAAQREFLGSLVSDFKFAQKELMAAQAEQGAALVSSQGWAQSWAESKRISADLEASNARLGAAQIEYQRRLDAMVQNQLAVRAAAVGQRRAAEMAAIEAESAAEMAALKAQLAAEAAAAERAAAAARITPLKVAKVAVPAGLIAGVIASKSIKDAMDYQQAHTMLITTLKNTKGGMADAAGAIDKLDAKFRQLGSTNTETEDAFRILLKMTGNQKDALRAMQAAADVAARGHYKLSDAAVVVGRAMTGNTRQLHMFGIQLPVLTSGEGRLTQARETAHRTMLKLQDAYAAYNNAHVKSPALQIRLRDAFLANEKAQRKLTEAQQFSNTVLKTIQHTIGGASKTLSETAAGSLRKAKAEFNNLGVQIGKVFLPIVATLGKVAAAVFGAIGKHPLLVKALAIVIGTVLVLAIVAATVALWNMAAAAVSAGFALVAPFLPVIAIIAAVGFTIWLLWKHWHTVWNGIKTATSAVWSVLKPIFHAIGWFIMHIPLVYLLTHWKQTWHLIGVAMHQAWERVKNIGKAIVGFFAGAGHWLIDAGKHIIQGLINGIKNFAKHAVNAVKDVGKAILHGFKSFFGISSPSLVMSENGGHLATGLAEGIKKKKKKPLDEWQIMMNQLLGASNPAADFLKQGMGIDYGVADGVKKNTSKAKAAVRRMMQEISETSAQTYKLSLNISDAQKAVNAHKTTLAGVQPALIAHARQLLATAKAEEAKTRGTKAHAAAVRELARAQHELNRAMAMTLPKTQSAAELQAMTTGMETSWLAARTRAQNFTFVGGADVTVPVHIDGVEVFRAVQRQSLKNARRNTNNGLALSGSVV